MSEAEARPSTVLVVMAHPDDGEFMCGATIARWAREGRDVHYCVLTSGDVGTTDFEMTSERLAELRRREQNEAARQLGVQHDVIFLGYVDAQLTPSLEIRRDVTRIIRQVRPDIVLTQDPTTFYHGQSYINHPDHRYVGEITMAAVMPSASMHLIFPELYRDEGLAPHRVQELYLTNTQHADRWVEVTEEDLNRQVAGLRAHASQLSHDPTERVFAGAREDAAEARKFGHDFTYAEGFKYFKFRS
jgi:LmbE family N-acetylglucosaminyl deacetylase